MGTPIMYVTCIGAAFTDSGNLRMASQRCPFRSTLHLQLSFPLFLCPTLVRAHCKGVNWECHFFVYLGVDILFFPKLLYRSAQRDPKKKAPTDPSAPLYGDALAE